MIIKIKHEVKKFFNFNKWQWLMFVFVMLPTWGIGVHAIFHDPKYALIFFTMSIALALDIKSKATPSS